MAPGKTAWEQASDWFGRTIAIVLVMIAPGALGAWLDKQLGTEFLAGVGFVFGMALAITLLLIFTRIKKIDNDSPEFTKAVQSGSVQSAKRTNRAKPSESNLPELPGADVYEAPKRDE